VARKYRARDAEASSQTNSPDLPVEMDHDAGRRCRRLRLARLGHRRRLVRQARHPWKSREAPGSGVHGEADHKDAMAWREAWNIFGFARKLCPSDSICSYAS